MNNKLMTLFFTFTMVAGTTAFGMHRGGHRGHGHRGWRHHGHHGMHQQNNNNNNINDPATTPNPAYMLQFACMTNDQAIATALLQRPDIASFINAINDYSQTALDITQAKLNLDLEQALKDKGGQTAVEVFAAAPNPGELLRRACK
ncbi:MAG: hypothetical protein KC505_10785, partial [Myxococcales bacterium]|nr:hypothetical protein [Myxococcales bacterium]